MAGLHDSVYIPVILPGNSLHFLVLRCTTAIIIILGGGLCDLILRCVQLMPLMMSAHQMVMVLSFLLNLMSCIANCSRGSALRVITNNYWFFVSVHP